MQASVHTTCTRSMQPLLFAGISCHKLTGRCREDLQAALTIPVAACVAVLSPRIYCDSQICAAGVQAWLIFQ